MYGTYHPGYTSYLQDPSDCGVYLLTCKSTMRIYVGSSSCVSNRFYTHMAQAKSGLLFSDLMLSDYHTHGQESFTCTMLQECNPETLKYYEAIWMHKFKQAGFELYNRLFLRLQPKSVLPALMLRYEANKAEHIEQMKKDSRPMVALV
ncbi:GIY-YIG nuclease family protein [Spirosoma sordidisoli]|uniref:GIY-YIG domain-containing protein n=1 Tax=Spirosoma sordidisoli TaxID=2502893 RepID=A0A4Q2USG9_9BACT|nr:GIY-YIG nuclease family protein [Spirosoma sordidisoli]RYC70705.1 hypothetical protein EQG79_00705 [Spirosoma sordidisoli]